MVSCSDSTLTTGAVQHLRRSSVGVGQVGSRIVTGRTYIYESSWPEGWKGQLYRCEGLAVHVPSYQDVVVVKCVFGKDIGKLLTYSQDRFVQSHRLVEE